VVQDGPEHKLVAILAADIVAYSRLMEADQAGTHSQLGASRKEVVDPAIAEHGGRTFKTTGDGFLVEFPSPLNAVRCALAIQQDMARRNEHVPDASRIVFRIGVNLGDVIIDGDDLYGNGVNITARLESISDPGGVCISGKVHEEVSGEPGLKFEDRGPQTVKNISKPVQAYAVDLGESVRAVAPAAKSTRMTPAIAIAAVVLVAVISSLAWQSTRPPTVEAAVVANMAFDLPDGPSIAVLAFNNRSIDPGDELLADSFSEDILTALAKLPGMFVISRTTSFTYKGKDVTVKQVAEDLGVRYVLEGSFQRSGNSVRVTAQLIDALSGAHVWADNFDRTLDDLFAMKDEITFDIVSNIGAELQLGDRDLIRRRETESLEAWLLQREGYETLQKFTPDANVRGKALLEQAIEADPQFAIAYANLALAYRLQAQFGWVEDRERSWERSLELYEQAVEIDPFNAPALGSFAAYYLVRGDLALAAETARKAISFEPNDYFAYAILGWALMFTDGTEQEVLATRSEALESFSFSARLSPRGPDWVLLFHGQTLLLLGEYARAESKFREVLSRPPSSRGNESWARQYLAIVLAETGRREEARAEIALSMDVFPRRTIAYILNSMPYAPPELREGWADSWRRLGLPEE